MLVNILNWVATAQAILFAERMTFAYFCCWVCGVNTPWKLLPSSKEAAAALLPKLLVFGWWSSLVQLVPVLEGGCSCSSTKAAGVWLVEFSGTTRACP